MDHKADHGEGDHGLGDFGQVLIILGQTPPPAEPTECPFHHPSAWQHDKALGAWNTADDDQRDAEQEARKQRGHAVVDAVGEHGPEPAVEWLDAPEQIACAVAILDGGGMHEHAKQQSLGVHRNVALAPIDLLGRVVAARPPAFSGLHALGVDDRSGRAGLAPHALAQRHHEVMAHAVPYTGAQESAEVALYGRPRQECRRRRQVPPLTTGAQQVKQAVQ